MNQTPALKARIEVTAHENCPLTMEPADGGNYRRVRLETEGLTVELVIYETKAAELKALL